ncbi:MAG: hypothetical protein AAGB14_04515 [Verrucomicrobiota bacterium]
MDPSHPSPESASSQCALILAALIEANGEEVGHDQLVKVSGSHVIGTRVSNLREKGHRIECRVERQKNHKAHSFYRLIQPEPAKA